MNRTLRNRMLDAIAVAALAFLMVALNAVEALRDRKRARSYRRITAADDWADHAERVAERIGTNLTTRQRLAAVIGKEPTWLTVKYVLDAGKLADEYGDDYVSPDHLLLAMLQHTAGSPRQTFALQGARVAEIEAGLRAQSMGHWQHP